MAAGLAFASKAASRIAMNEGAHARDWASGREGHPARDTRQEAQRAKRTALGAPRRSTNKIQAG
eukprot:4221621-Prymnesium_polylepis.2